MSHTPGPWIIAGRDGTAIAPAAMPNERLAVAMAMDCELTEENMYGEDVPLASQVANARLMAAAPDMLAALKLCVELETNCDGEVICFCDDPEIAKHGKCYVCVVRDAIAKAEGTKEGITHGEDRRVD